MFQSGLPEIGTSPAVGGSWSNPQSVSTVMPAGSLGQSSVGEKWAR